MSHSGSEEEEIIVTDAERLLHSNSISVVSYSSYTSSQRISNTKPKLEIQGRSHDHGHDHDEGLDALGLGLSLGGGGEGRGGSGTTGHCPSCQCGETSPTNSPLSHTHTHTHTPTHAHNLANNNHTNNTNNNTKQNDKKKKKLRSELKKKASNSTPDLSKVPGATVQRRNSDGSTSPALARTKQRPSTLVVEEPTRQQPSTSATSSSSSSLTVTLPPVGSGSGSLSSSPGALSPSKVKRKNGDKKEKEKERRRSVGDCHPLEGIGMLSAKEWTHESILTLNVGGKRFCTSIGTLRKDSGSMLAAMFSGRYTPLKDASGAYFIDRDGTHFRFVLNYLRDGSIDLMDDITVLRQLMREAQYYQIESLISLLRDKMEAVSYANRPRQLKEVVHQLVHVGAPETMQNLSEKVKEGFHIDGLVCSSDRFYSLISKKYYAQ